MARRVYSKEESDAILARAIELQGRGDITSHEDLIAAGREVGLPAVAVERAAAEMMSRRRDEDILREMRARRWRGFYAHLLPYVLTNLLLAFANTLTGGPPWMLFVTLGWGIGLASHLLAVANPDPRRLQRQVERERKREDGIAHAADAPVRVASFSAASEASPPRGEDYEEDEADGSRPARGAR